MRFKSVKHLPGIPEKTKIFRSVLMKKKINSKR